MRPHRIPHRIAVILSTIIMLMTGTTTAAHAQALAAWDCPAGDVCVYSGFDGTGSRCNWANQDSDWSAAPIVCSWAATTNVRSVYNRGQSTSYLGVLLYKTPNFNFNDIWSCIGQGKRFTFISGLADGVRLASHRWTNSFPYC
jgi:hypothetical protein